jgi:hypothetical protein
LTGLAEDLAAASGALYPYEPVAAANEALYDATGVVVAAVTVTAAA